MYNLSMYVISAILVSPIFLLISETCLRVFSTGMTLDVPFNVHFFWLRNINIKKIIYSSSYQFYYSTLRLYITSVFFLFILISRQKEAEIISDILLRAASEPDFRNLLIKNSAEILEKYNISNEAKYIIKKSIIDFTQW